MAARLLPPVRMSEAVPPFPVAPIVVFTVLIDFFQQGQKRFLLFRGQDISSCRRCRSARASSACRHPSSVKVISAVLRSDSLRTQAIKSALFSLTMTSLAEPA